MGERASRESNNCSTKLRHKRKDEMKISLADVIIITMNEFYIVNFYTICFVIIILIEREAHALAPFLFSASTIVISFSRSLHLILFLLLPFFNFVRNFFGSGSGNKKNKWKWNISCWRRHTHGRNERNDTEHDGKCNDEKVSRLYISGVNLAYSRMKWNEPAKRNN